MSAQTLPPHVHGSREDLAPVVSSLKPMFESLTAATLSEDNAKVLAKSMTQLRHESEIPAGYTYLAQFISHDVSFDPSVSLRPKAEKAALANIRTPRLDLETLYGGGPMVQPYLYEADGVRMRLGEVLGPQTRPPDDSSPRDLPRNDSGRAIVCDPRNDEHVIMAQLHAVFLQFHNRVAEVLKSPTFLSVQDAVRWHYQWVILHDYLPRVSDKLVYDDVLGDPYNPRFKVYKFTAPAVPVEFAMAADRYAHSMVRASYQLNANSTDRGVTGPFPILRTLADGTPDLLNSLVGLRRFRRDWVIDWRFFFEGAPQPSYVSNGNPTPTPQRAMRIDTFLSWPLDDLPNGLTPPGAPPSLAALDLLRGKQVGLPSGQDVARKMGLMPLSDDVLFARRRDLKPCFAGNAPLWYYLLAEAEQLNDGERLGPVGSRVVVETLAGLLSLDEGSVIHQPSWKPYFLTKSGDFGMGELISAALS